MGLFFDQNCRNFGILFSSLNAIWGFLFPFCNNCVVILIYNYYVQDLKYLYWLYCFFKTKCTTRKWNSSVNVHLTVHIQISRSKFPIKLAAIVAKKSLNNDQLIYQFVKRNVHTGHNHTFFDTHNEVQFSTKLQIPRYYCRYQILRISLHCNIKSSRNIIVVESRPDHASL